MLSTVQRTLARQDTPTSVPGTTLARVIEMTSERFCHAWESKSVAKNPIGA